MTESVYFSARVWYLLGMESECPDPFPCPRGLPDDFELQGCYCHACEVHYYGIRHLRSGGTQPFYLVYGGRRDPCKPGEGGFNPGQLEDGRIRTEMIMKLIERGELKFDSSWMQCGG